MMRPGLAAAAITAWLALAGCAPSGPYGEDFQAANAGELPVVKTALAIGDCTKLAEAVAKAGLEELLAAAGPFTLFAPSDAAFLTLRANRKYDPWTEDPVKLRELLLGHVVEGDLRAQLLVRRSTLSTMASTELRIEIVQRQAMVDDARITRGDAIATNGVVHFIDRVLVPGDDGADDDQPR